MEGVTHLGTGLVLRENSDQEEKSKKIPSVPEPS